jgi:hypothetical protein
VAQVAECLLSKHKALSSNPSTTKKKKNFFVKKNQIMGSLEMSGWLLRTEDGIWDKSHTSVLHMVRNLPSWMQEGSPGCDSKLLAHFPKT